MPSARYVPLPDLPARQAFDPDERSAEPAFHDELASASAGPEIQLTGPLKGAVAIRGELSATSASARVLVQAAHRVLYGSPVLTPVVGSPGLPPIDESQDPSHAAKIEREAQLSVEVKDVGTAASAILSLLRQRRGYVTKDERAAYGDASANLMVKVPAGALDSFLDAVASVGTVKGSRVTAVDATLEHKDIETLVMNLEAAQARYRDILLHTAEPAQVLAVERELERVRTELDRIKGRLDFLRDRVAYATVAISLSPPPRVGPAAAASNQATLATSLHAVTFVDFRESGDGVYYGPGLALRFPRTAGDSGRGLALDVDAMRACCGSAPRRSDWAYDVLAGLDLFSESFESGQRRWLNPFLGLRVGVAQTQGWVDFAAAAVIGIEILKTRVVTVEAQARLLALVGSPDGPHAAVQPLAGVDIGF
jgi:hypothetical protein